MNFKKFSHQAFSLSLLIWLGIASNAYAQKNAEGIRFFENHIRPLLLNECSKCHGAEKQKGHLRLDKPAFIARGGDSGDLYHPGQAEKSLIIKAVQREIVELEMPPKKHLAENQIDLIKTWINKGAPLPDFTPITQAKNDELAGDLDAVQSYWSFQRIKKTHPKALSKISISNNSIDIFIQNKLTQKGLSTAQPAEPILLLRRLYFGLIGLPPNEQQIEEFLSEPLDTAYPKVVEKLLSSKHYGEKWGKHWLNLVRYAESTGKDENHRLPYAHKYRDYVIQTFNEDTPFDQFIMQQLASDLMEQPSSEAEKIKRIPATAFNVFGAKNIAERDLDQLCMDVVDEQLDNVSLTFLGLTMSCARCHDHKFDPISTKEYYSLAGIFKSTQTLDDWTPTAIKQHYSKSMLTEKEQSHNAAFQNELHPLLEQYKKLERNPRKNKEQQKKFKELQKKLKEIETKLIPDERSYALADFPKTPKDKKDLVLQDCKIHVRGSYQNQKGEPIPRSPPQIFNHLYASHQVPADQSGRLQLAQWIAHPKNPLTARVIANRIWAWHFGNGIVRTTSNFGTTGEQPSHPELLDYLANYLIENNWSLKELHRHIVASATYQQAYRNEPKAVHLDPDRRLLWSFPEQRLDAEIIRDRVLSASGELNPNPSPKPPVNIFGKRNHEPSFHHNKERSVYLSVVRNRIHPMFRIFNFNTASMPIPQRENSTLSTQSLFMSNSPFIYAQAQKTAARLLAHPKEKRLQKLFMWIYSRPAKENEETIIQNYFKTFQQKHNSEHKTWTLLVQSLFQTHEFLNIN